MLEMLVWLTLYGVWFFAVCWAVLGVVDHAWGIYLKRLKEYQSIVKRK